MGTIYLSCNLQEIRAAMQLDPSRLQIQSSKDEWMLCESLGERELRLAHAVPVIKHSQTSWHQPSPASLSWWHLVTSLADSYRTAETTGTWEERRVAAALPGVCPVCGDASGLLIVRAPHLMEFLRTGCRHWMTSQTVSNSNSHSGHRFLSLLMKHETIKHVVSTCNDVFVCGNDSE